MSAIDMQARREQYVRDAQRLGKKPIPPAEWERRMARMAALKFLADTYPDGDPKKAEILDRMPSHELYDDARDPAREQERATGIAERLQRDPSFNELERLGRAPVFSDPPWLAELAQATTRDSTDDNGRAAEQAALESELHSIHERFHAK